MNTYENKRKTCQEDKMKFDNVLARSECRIALKKALAEWMLGFDGQEFATGEVLQRIPWSDDLNRVIPWDDVDREFDNAIGSRGEWCRGEIVVNNADGEGFRRRFWAEVDGKCAAICEIYSKYIDKANDIHNSTSATSSTSASVAAATGTR